MTPLVSEFSEENQTPPDSTIALMRVVLCGLPRCGISFETTNPRRRFHTRSCQKEDEERVRLEKSGKTKDTRFHKPQSTEPFKCGYRKCDTKMDPKKSGKPWKAYCCASHRVLEFQAKKKDKAKKVINWKKK